jgi:uncharacterized protein YecE (DUF72 family)
MIRVGIGGWTFEPWRGPFYPAGLKHADELAFASRAVTAIEINGTYYMSPKPASFRKWASETPHGFVFSVKASRYIVNRKDLAAAGESIERFVGGGLAELGDKLGPVLWQLAPTKRFSPAEIDAFLGLLPKSLAGRPMRHALEVRHPTFQCAEFVALARHHGVAVVLADSDKYPLIADITGDFAYARLQRCSEAEPAGYPRAALK